MPEIPKNGIILLDAILANLSGGNVKLQHWRRYELINLTPLIKFIRQSFRLMISPACTAAADCDCSAAGVLHNRIGTVAPGSPGLGNLPGPRPGCCQHLQHSFA